MDELLIDARDGRDLEVLVGGDPDGFPWLYHGGTPSAAVASDILDRAARDAGLRLITYSRPGYGRSTPRPWPRPRIADDLADSVVVLDGLGVDQFVTLGWSGGGPRALACAALLPRRCRAATSLAGVAPADAPDLDFTAGMGPENVEEFAAAVAGPEAYSAFLAEPVAELATVTGDQVAASLGELITPVDAAAVTGEFAEWLAATFRHAAVQGVIGWREDGIAIMGPWEFSLHDVRVPVAIWQGGQDAMVPFSHGQWLAANVPGARTHLFEDEGHISVFAKLDEILADLKDLAGLD
ncbi:alpha/beta fold hydrolase [Nocardioides marmorisolisilvae]|uniref:Alpha/beta fold hydrolase n=1 Tax=Nocardioides marmorisolisilvae TaxID=1542737 RepID=A0A3N0DP57_9ACTN|nr:alpha/beta fold hydrolase [Nocardioides marmorisolisilvae]RNL77430.1 alpha/beta fold hydrolase [Nocardioides marmorisolisilvae]